MKAIINGVILTKKELLKDKVIIFDKKIEKIIGIKEFKKNYCKYEGIQIIDAKGIYISPGFIDIHIHGAGGCDVMDGDIEAIETISKTICKNGVTSFLPTTMTMSKEQICKALNSIREVMTKEKIDNIYGAKVIGAHMEGPFVSEKFKGAQNSKYIMKPDYSFIEKYTDVIKIITLAPEEDNNHKFIKKVKKNTEIILSMGHSNACYEEAMKAIKDGITQTTHTFNAMKPLHHREPGVVGAALESDIYCELIADKIHVHPGIFNILLKVKEKEKIVLITDCMKAGNLNEGEYELGGQKVIVKNGSAKLENGTLAGSILKLNEAVRNIYENTDLSINEVINMVSLNPAKILKMYNEKGSVEVGKDADLILIDKNFDVKMTIVEGKIVYK
ncbi:N-acetylglucosamine-6-phosphate deacetylase [Clostridium aestuarii]|uniref:N-acetylglucosamine-6-phosphate deacetylase n=1 Tax=Clostridium aestuarii TaxID=338193 RepID=A0ABT4CYX8_9CLOT|nr:N-acetylglucosamine-6-phosphate deacetylase [Clostridium aestuarii]